MFTLCGSAFSSYIIIIFKSILLKRLEIDIIARFLSTFTSVSDVFVSSTNSMH